MGKIVQSSEATSNYIIKTRAQRYIAAAEKSWLYPENTIKKKDWFSFDTLFLSKRFESLGTGKETFILGKDGKIIATQDEFGRKPKNKEELEEKQQEVQAIKERLDRILKNKIK